MTDFFFSAQSLDITFLITTFLEKQKTQTALDWHFLNTTYL